MADPWPAPRLLRAGVVAGLLLFAVVSIDYEVRGPIYAADQPIQDAMTHLNATGWPIHLVGKVLSQPGGAPVDFPLVVIGAILCWRWRQRGLAAWLVGMAIFGALVVQALKLAFHRPLPSPFDQHDHWGYAFPSGHTMAATFTVGLVLFLVGAAWQRSHPATRDRRRMLLAWWIGLALVTGIARVLLQVHWAGDVWAAWGLGTALLCVTLLGVTTQAKGPATPTDEAIVAATTDQAPAAQPPVAQALAQAVANPVQALAPSEPSVPKVRRWQLFGMIGGLLGFALLALDDVLKGPVYHLDSTINDWVSAGVNSGLPLHSVGDFGSLPGATLVLAPIVAVCAVTWWLWRERRIAYWAVVGGGGAGLLVAGLKYLFERSRPLGAVAPEYSFPSGHTMGATATLGILLILGTQVHVDRKRITGLDAEKVWARGIKFWILTTFVVGASRVLSQNHWMSDVVASWCLGVAVVCAVVRMAGIPRPRAKPPPPPEPKPVAPPA